MTEETKLQELGRKIDSLEAKIGLPNVPNLLWAFVGFIVVAEVVGLVKDLTHHLI